MVSSFQVTPPEQASRGDHVIILGLVILFMSYYYVPGSHHTSSSLFPKSTNFATSFTTPPSPSLSSANYSDRVTFC